MIDGAKALAAAVKEVFGGLAAVQRCTLHYAEQRIMPSWDRESFCGKRRGLVKSA